MRLKRLLPLSFVAGALGALALAAPAFANSDAGSCQINGTAGTSDTAHPGEGVQQQGGSGTYSFNANVGGTALHLRCAGVDTTDQEVAVAQVDANSNGAFTNTVCGTGTATSNPGQSSASIVGTP